MAFFRNYNDKTPSWNVLLVDDERGERETIGDDGIGNGEPTCSDKETELNPSLQHTNASSSGRRTTTPAPASKWGSSTFWKESQPKSESEDEEDIGEKKEAANKGGVPVDEMLSDDYYEQDGDDQSDTLHHTNAAIYSNPPLSANDVHYSRATQRGQELGADGDFDSDEDEDVDDPEDVDFDPDFGGTQGHGRKKDNDWDADNFDEDDNSDNDDIEVSDEDDVPCKKRKGRQLGSRELSLKSSRGSKSFAGRQKRGRVSFYEEDSSAKDSQNESDEDFGTITRTGVQPHKSTSRRFASSRSKNNEVRTSTRSVRKVSYAESEESEEFDEIKRKKSLKEDVEEEDSDYIEKVLWHQAKGTAEEAMRNNRSTEPVLSSHLFNTEPDWNDMEFLIKWKGHSHLHCQWRSFAELQNLSGFKKVINYTKKVMEDIRYRKAVSREEIEVNDVSKEMDLDIIKQYSQVERVISDRVTRGDAVPEFLVKWRGLSYAEATW